MAFSSGIEKGTIMKLHPASWSLWVPLSAIVFLLLGYVAMTLMAEPGARLPRSGE
jgi:hypothetical protein